MKGREIDDPGHLIGLKPRRFPNWGARQQPIKICPLSIYLCVVSNDVDDHSAPKFSVLCTVYYRIICP